MNHHLYIGGQKPEVGDVIERVDADCGGVTEVGKRYAVAGLDTSGDPKIWVCGNVEKLACRYKLIRRAADRWPRRWATNNTLQCRYIEQLSANVTPWVVRLDGGHSRDSFDVEWLEANREELFDHLTLIDYPAEGAVPEAANETTSELESAKREIDSLNDQVKARDEEIAKLKERNKTLQMQLDLRNDPLVVDEARWLDERNTGMESFAKLILEGNNGSNMNDGPCREACQYVAKLRAENETLRNDVASLGMMLDNANRNYHETVGKNSALLSQLESQRLIREAERRSLGDRDIPRETLQLLVDCAFVVGEISIGRACELLGCDIVTYRERGLTQGDGMFVSAVDAIVKERIASEGLSADNKRLEKRLNEEVAKNGELQLDLGEANREIGNLEALREADCTKLLAYQAELRRQLNEAWMRLDYRTANRIADLIGDPKPSEHEAEDAKPDEREQQRQMEVQPPAEWPKVYRLDVPPPDICEVTFLNATQKAVSRHIKPDSEFDGLSWEYGEVNAANNWKLYSVGGRVVDGDEQPKHLTEALKQSAEEIDKEWRR